MFRSFRLGRAFGIPLYLHSTFLLIPLYALLLSLRQGPLGILFAQMLILTLFACILMHELGHALMARSFGIRTRDITLYPIGGVARLETTGGQPGEEIAIALAGPAVNLALVVLLAPLVGLAALAGFEVLPDRALAFGGPLDFLAAYLCMVAVGNLILLVFNLLPVFPMDGGRVLRALLSLCLPRLRATEIAATVGLLLAGGLGVLGLFALTPSLVLVSVFVAIAGQLELHALRRQEAARRREERLGEPVLLPPCPVRFTGLAWDGERGVWVHWVNGAPLDGR